MSGATQGTSRAGWVFGYGVFTLCDVSFNTLHLTFPVSHRGPTTPERQVSPVWAVPLSFATTEGIDSLSFPPLTEMFHFTGFASSRLCIQRGIVIADGVSPFGNPRIGLFAAPRGLSQLVASFFARCRQGIHTVACNFLLLAGLKSFAVLKVF